MRCDVNVSIHEPGEPWGTRTEIKNINSLSNIVRAMELEMERQEDIIESGEKVIQSTMRYDANSDTVYVLRSKENAAITVIFLSLIFFDSIFLRKVLKKSENHFLSFPTLSLRDMLRI